MQSVEAAPCVPGTSSALAARADRSTRNQSPALPTLGGWRFSVRMISQSAAEPLHYGLRTPARLIELPATVIHAAAGKTRRRYRRINGASAP